MNKILMLFIMVGTIFAAQSPNDSVYLPVKDSTKMGILKTCQDSLVQIGKHSKDSLETILLQFYTTPFGVECHQLLKQETKKQKKVRK